MKKRLLLVCGIVALALMTGCAGNKKPAETTAAATTAVETTAAETEAETEAAEPETEAETEAASGMAGMANPWVELTAEELTEKAGVTFGVPEDAKNVIYRYNESQQLAEMQFDFNDTPICARIMPAKAYTDISGVYVDHWDVEEDVMIDYCHGKVMRSITESETTDVCQWFDNVPGLMYCVTATAADLDGFDITAIANQIFVSVQGVVG